MRELAPQSKDGSYVRPSYAFQVYSIAQYAAKKCDETLKESSSLTASRQGAISSEPGAKFPDEPGRYHLYAGKACPW